MKEGETLWAYSDRYRELYSEIRGSNSDVVATTFKLELPMDSELRKSLILHPTENMHKLMERIEKYKRLEDDQSQAQSKEKYLVLERWKRRMDLPT